MNRLLLFSAAALLVTGAGVAWSAQGNGDPHDSVAGGGTFGPGCFDGPGNVCFARRRDFSVDAHGGPHGQNPSGQSYYGRNEADAVPSVVQDVICMRVEGNRGIVGGTQLADLGQGLQVVGWVREAEDNGPPGSGPRDRSGPTLTDFLDSADWPEGFPRTCPDFDWAPFLNTGMLPLHSGDVVVHDGNS